jgi:hypothetical protein
MFAVLYAPGFLGFAFGFFGLPLLLVRSMLSSFGPRTVALDVDEDAERGVSGGGVEVEWWLIGDIIT